MKIKLLTPGSEQICKNLLGTHAHSKVAGLLDAPMPCDYYTIRSIYAYADEVVNYEP
jgi:hypothetical protein